MEFSPRPGTYHTPQFVSISCAAPGVVIRFTVDGSDPTENSSQYASALRVSRSVIIKARAYKSGRSGGRIVAARYLIQPQTASPRFSVRPGAYSSPQILKIICPTPNAVIRITNDGNDPTEKSYVYSRPIRISSSMVVKARGFRQGWAPSDVAAATYKITGTVAAPTFSLKPGAYSQPQKVQILCSTPGAVIHYTTDGNEPTKALSRYSGPSR